jgi:hypothetical protein
MRKRQEIFNCLAQTSIKKKIEEKNKKTQLEILRKQAERRLIVRTRIELIELILE